MAYTIKNADGTVLLNLVDGTTDIKTTSLTLIGKNTDAYGTALNTNLVNILQNFASIYQPRAPLTGQLWYSKADGRLKVYTLNGIFENISTAFISQGQPGGLKQGDLWIDSDTSQLYFTIDGATSTLAGPIYPTTKGRSGFVVESFNDVFGNTQTVTSIYSNNVLLGMLSTSSFSMVPTVLNQGMSGISIGLTLNTSIPDIRFAGTASNATAIAGIFPNQYLLKSSNSNQLIEGTGNLSLLNDAGIWVGAYADLSISSGGPINARRPNVTNHIVDSALCLITMKSNPGGQDTAVTSLAAKGDRVGINTESPITNLHVEGNSYFNGDIIVTKNLTVSGTFTTRLSVITRIDDKNIELAYGSTSDTDSDGGGITLKAGIDKTFIYSKAKESWVSSINIEVGTTSSYRGGAGVLVINSSTIGSTVVSSNLQRVGVLTELTVSNVLIKGNGITASDAVFRVNNVYASALPAYSTITIVTNSSIPIISTGTTVVLDGIIDAGYNNTYQVDKITSSTQFTVRSLSSLTTTSPILGATPIVKLVDLMLSSTNGGVDITNKRVKNVGYSTVATDAATVQYVLDAQAINVLKGFVITIDITKMVNPNLEIATLLNLLTPPINTIPPEYPTEAQYDLPLGYRARVLCANNSIAVPARAITVLSTTTLVMSYPAGNAVSAITNIGAQTDAFATTATYTYSVKEFRVDAGPPKIWRWYRDVS